MSKFVAISGPSLTGKSALSDELSTYKELSQAIFVPDIHESVWNQLVAEGAFSSYSEINKDSEYLCLYIMRLIEYYNSIVSKYEGTDHLVILDGCWLDLLVYSMINLWYNRAIKSVQESILLQISKFDDRIDRIYLTSHDDNLLPNVKNRADYKMSNLKLNRALELRYYEIFRNLNPVKVLPSSEPVSNALYIIQDMEKLGYL